MGLSPDSPHAGRVSDEKSTSICVSAASWYERSKNAPSSKATSPVRSVLVPSSKARSP